MSQSIERLENLNRVMRHVDPAENFDMANWCNCAIGHARRDQYFIDNFNSDFGESLGHSPMAFIADYFGLAINQAQALFLSSDYHSLGRSPTPSDVVAKLEVVLLAKRADEPVVEGTRGLVEAKSHELALAE